MAKPLYLFNISDRHNTRDDGNADSHLLCPLHKIIEVAVFEKHLSDSKISTSLNLLFGVDHIHSKTRGFNVTFWIYCHPDGEGVEGNSKLHQVLGIAQAILRTELRCSFGRVSSKCQDIFDAESQVIAEDIP